MGFRGGGVLTEPLTPEPGLKGQVTAVELSRVERSAARRSAETRAIVPSVELMCEIELSGDPSLSVILAAAGRALRRSPRLNGAYRDGRYELYSRINIAVSLPAADGQVNATLFDADRKEASAIEAELTRLSQAAAEGRLSPGEQAGATFTVIPPSPHGVVLLTPLISPSQAATLAIGPIRERAVARDGALAAGRRLQLVLACDHRIVQVPQAAEFLGQLNTALEAEPD